MSYTAPVDVVSPKAHWKLFEVVLDDGPGQAAMALGFWDDDRRLAFRWNGTKATPLGNPQSRGLPTWTILDPKMYLAVVRLLPEDKQALATTFLRLGVPPTVELRISRHPSGNHTLMRRSPGQRMYEDFTGRLRGNNDRAAFYEAVLHEVKENLDKGSHVDLQHL